VPLDRVAPEARSRHDETSRGGNLRKRGIMNIFLLYVNNLRRWFTGAIGTTGNLAINNSG
jgi:hypothetical protein